MSLCESMKFWRVVERREGRLANLNLLMDLGLALLLAAAIFQALRLDRALQTFKQDRGALGSVLDGFTVSIRDAEAGAAQLRDIVDTTSIQLARQVKVCESLKDDLDLLIQRGDRLASRLEGPFPPGGFVPTTGPISSGNPINLRMQAEQEVGPPQAPRGRSQAERDLLQALRSAR